MVFMFGLGFYSIWVLIFEDIGFFYGGIWLENKKFLGVD